MAMPDNILDMCFNQNPEDFADDEHFLQAIYRAGLQVEKRKALKTAKEALKGITAGGSGSKDGQGSGKDSGRGRNGQETSKRGKEKDHKQDSKKSGSGGQAEKPGDGKETSAKKCGRCLRTGHSKDNCWAKKDANGTEITSKPMAEAPEGFFSKTSAARNSSSGATKRKRETEDDAQKLPAPVRKQAKTSAARTTDEDMRDLPIWAESPQADF
jgi:hypothetical protein